MKILHCADLHLDSSMESHLSAAKAATRKSEMRATMSAMWQFAAGEGVGIVLICGDLFDEDVLPDERSVQYFLDSVSNFPDMHFYYVCGNHEGSNWIHGKKIPSNLFLFDSRSWTYYTEGNLTLAGCIAQDNNGYEQLLSLPVNTVNIVLLHGQYGTAEGAEINLKRLQHKNIDYLALGHLHTYQEGTLDERGIFVYSGCMEGRGFDECGPKGFVLADVDETNGMMAHRFVQAHGRTVEIVEVPVDGCMTLMDTENRVSDCLKDVQPASLVRIVLSGHYLPQTQKDIKGLENNLKSKYFYAEVEDHSRLEINYADYEYDISLKGEFIRLVHASKLSEEEKEKVIYTGIRALSGEVIDI